MYIGAALSKLHVSLVLFCELKLTRYFLASYLWGEEGWAFELFISL